MRNINFIKIPTVMAIMGLTSLACITSVSAANVKMSVFEGYKSSEAVLVGDYVKAIELANLSIGSKSSYRRTVEATSLCVAYTKSGMLEIAKDFCEMAVENSTKSSTLRNAANSYSDEMSAPISIIEVTEINHKAMLSLVNRKELSANVL